MIIIMWVILVLNIVCGAGNCYIGVQDSLLLNGVIGSANWLIAGVLGAQISTFNS